MSIFPLPLLLILFSLLVCPVASQTGQKVEERQHGACTSAQLIKTAADCQAAAKVLGLAGTVEIARWVDHPPGCSWYRYYASGQLLFNTNTASTKACNLPSHRLHDSKCLCVDPCPIGKYQNEESSTTCKSCLPGTYNDEIGRLLCQNCTIGKYNNEIGESTCRNCPAGKTSQTGASHCQPNCCHAKANYPTYEKDCNTITDAAACSDRLHHLVYTCDWNCDDKMVVNIHNVSQDSN